MKRVVTQIDQNRMNLNLFPVPRSAETSAEVYLINVTLSRSRPSFCCYKLLGDTFTDGSAVIYKVEGCHVQYVYCMFLHIFSVGYQIKKHH